MKKNIEHIRSLCTLSDETVQLLEANVVPIHFPRKTLMVQAGQRCRNAFFVEKGMTRSFWMVNGEEVTTSFAGEGSIVFSMDELYYNKESEEYVEALEEVDAYQIEIPTLQHLFETNLELCNWGRIIHQNEYRRLHRSHKEGLTLSAKERYEEFKKQFPDVCQRVNLGFIASYLGITLPTLSRIRSVL